MKKKILFEAILTNSDEIVSRVMAVRKDRNEGGLECLAYNSNWKVACKAKPRLRKYFHSDVTGQNCVDYFKKYGEFPCLDPNESCNDYISEEEAEVTKWRPWT